MPPSDESSERGPSRAARPSRQRSPSRGALSPVRPTVVITITSALAGGGENCRQRVGHHDATTRALGAAAERALHHRSSGAAGSRPHHVSASAVHGDSARAGSGHAAVITGATACSTVTTALVRRGETARDLREHASPDRRNRGARGFGETTDSIASYPLLSRRRRMPPRLRLTAARSTSSGVSDDPTDPRPHRRSGTIGGLDQVLGIRVGPHRSGRGRARVRRR